MIDCYLDDNFFLNKLLDILKKFNIYISIYTDFSGFWGCK